MQANENNGNERKADGLTSFHYKLLNYVNVGNINSTSILRLEFMFKSKSYSTLGKSRGITARANRVPSIARLFIYLSIYQTFF